MSRLLIKVSSCSLAESSILSDHWWYGTVKEFGMTKISKKNSAMEKKSYSKKLFKDLLSVSGFQPSTWGVKFLTGYIKKNKTGSWSHQRFLIESTEEKELPDIKSLIAEMEQWIKKLKVSGTLP